MDAADFARHLGAKATPTGWIARCPAHEDRSPSLSISEGEGGRLLLHCHAGCTFDDILHAAAVEPTKQNGANFNGHAQDNTRRSRIVATYNYHDAEGRLAFQVVRFAPKDFRQRRPARADDPPDKIKTDRAGHGWIWDTQGVELVPYHLPEILTANGRTIWLAEGEKGADALRGLGLVGTCSPRGAGRWQPAYAPHFAAADVVILPDNDDPGRKHAEAVAAGLRGVAARVRTLELPGLPEKGDPFDWVQAGGTAEVLERLAREVDEAGDDWPDIVPLYVDDDRPAPYPLDALPPTMRAAVADYQRFGQQPVELVACSALAAVSLAAQGLADVSRDGNLTGPCSLSIITVAASGERKTAADKRMRRALSRWEDDKRSEMQPAIAAAERRLAIWEAERDGMLAKLKRLAGSTKADDRDDAEAIKADLVQHDFDRPKIPQPPRLFYEDATPERLASALAKGWPSASLWSDEGGLVIGSHAMSEDVALRFLALLNRLWDGNRFDRDRETRGCISIRGRRFTASLMMQPGALAKLTAAGGGVARAIGALARYLVAWPTSTVGTRLYREGNTDSPALTAFDARLRDLLDHALPLNDQGELQPPVLRLSREAFEVWRELHDTVEHELSARGEFGELPDFGAKLAEQAARVAGVLHLFVYGPEGEIGPETMNAGARLALWHLIEARRVLGLVGHNGETADAETLLGWLREQSESPTVRTAQQFGPSALRKRERLDPGIAKLTEHGLARVEQRGRAQVIALNPRAKS
jgi:hypothetical protein